MNSQARSACYPRRTFYPLSLREPSCASVTLLEATAPVKLPTRQCSRPGLRAWVRSPEQPGWYFNVGSIEARPSTSKPPTYPTQTDPNFTAKLKYHPGCSGLLTQA